MKKLFALLLAVVLVFSLFACTAGGKTETPAESTDASAATPAEETKTDAPAETTGETGEIGGKLVIWEHNSSFEDALKAVIEGFNEKYPNVEVEYSVKTSDQYYNLLQTAMQANECPDLFWTNGKLRPTIRLTLTRD